MTKLNPIEHKILKVMVEKRRYMSTRRISECTRTSWNTSRKYLEIFFRKGWVLKAKRGNRRYWKARIK